MSFPSININRASGQLGRFGDEQGAAALIAGGVSTTALDLDTIYVLKSLKAAERLNIDAAYDVDNKILLYYHIREFFRMNPNGELHLMVVGRATGMTAMAGAEAMMAKIILEGKGRIRQIGLVQNQEEDYVPDSAAGMDVDVIAAMKESQKIANWAAENHLWIDCVFVEGVFFTNASSLIDLRASAYRDVALVLGNDNIVAHSIENDRYKYHAAIGTLLGLSMAKPIHESFAWAQAKNSVTDLVNGYFEQVGMSNGRPIAMFLGEDLEDLHNKGAIFLRTFTGVSGAYWQQSSNCVAVDDDFNSIELRQVINQAVRLVYGMLVRYINWNVPVNGEGRLKTTSKKMIEAEIRSLLDSSMGNSYSELSFVEVDPSHDDQGDEYPTIIQDSTLRANIGIRPFGKAETINVTIGFSL